MPNYRFPERWSTLEATLCHDWLTGMRGGERVLEILCQGLPEAGLRTLISNPDVMPGIIRNRPIQTSWLQHLPGILRHYRHLLPLFPLAVESLRPASGDILISTSHCVAKAMRHRPETRHLCYCFTPMRYAWVFQREYLKGNPLKAALAAPLLAALRSWDRRTARRVDRFVAISRHVQKRIHDFYGRPSDIVYPPVDTEMFTPGPAAGGDFDLVVSALVPYKRVDLAVEAYNRLGTPLKIVGVGGELDALKQRARPNIEFLGWVEDAATLELYRQCRLLVFPGEEDFGIVPLEAQACGRPVVAFRKGGALETIREGVSGVFFDEQTTESLVEAVSQCADTAWDRDAVRANAEAFGAQHFIDGLAESVQKCLDGEEG